MSKSEDRVLSERYRAAPRAKSPDELDARILRAARDHAPAPATRTTLPWVPALAGACVAGLAIYVATPLLNPESTGTAPVDRYQPAADAVQRAGTLDREAAESTGEKSMAAPAAAPTINGAAGFSRGISAQPEPVVQTDASTDTRPVANEMREPFDSDDSGVARSTVATTATAPQPAEEREQPAAAEMVVSRAPLTAAEIDRRLEEITDLANNALLDEAQRLLEALISRCPDCELPTTVAELPLAEAGPEPNMQ
jgi:hypothetical protein